MLNYPGKSSSLSYVNTDLAVSMTAQSDALAVATIANWIDVSGWNVATAFRPTRDATDPQAYFAPQEFMFEMWNNVATSETITSPSLWGIRKCALTYADATFTTTHASELVNINTHLLLTGDGPFYVSTDGTLPAGYSALTPYWVILNNANSFKLASSLANALAGTAVAITSDGSGTHTFSDVQSAESPNPDNRTKRLRFFKYGALNGGTTITLAGQTAYVERIAHDPLTLWYSVLGTSGTGAQSVTVRLVPVSPMEF